MPTWAPIQFLDPLVTISTLSMVSAGGVYLSASAPSTVNWPAANRAIYVPMRLGRPFLVAKLWWHNGTVAGPPNVDCGIYTSDGRRLLSTGSTAQGSSTVIQSVDVTHTWLDAGLYYLALAVSANTSAMFRTSVSASALRAIGVVQQASALPLPTTATFATAASSYLPYFGCSSRATV